MKRMVLHLEGVKMGGLRKWLGCIEKFDERGFGGNFIDEINICKI
jgi:hypothetical protein